MMRPRLPRSAMVWWLACLVLAAVTALLVGTIVNQAAEARDAYGSTRRVAVSTVALRPGQPVVPESVEVRDLPASLVPEGALAGVPQGRVATAEVLAGEPLVAERLSGPGGRTGPGGLLEPGDRAVAAPLAGPAPALEPGDRVDLFVATGRPAPVVTDVVVITATPESVTVGVPEAETSAVAASIADGGVVVALRG